MSTADRIRAKLEAEFTPTRLVIIDDSHRHKGHPGAREGGESHFKVEMTARLFQGKTRLQRQRAVHDVLDAELKGGVHALQLVLHAPGEDAHR